MRLHFLSQKHRLTVKFNHFRFKVETYEVKYLNLGENVKKQTVALAAGDLKDGKIVLDNFPQAVDKGVKIEGRIKYLGFDSWSPWISSKSQVSVWNTNQFKTMEDESKQKVNYLRNT